MAGTGGTARSPNRTIMCIPLQHRAFIRMENRPFPILRPVASRFDTKRPPGPGSDRGHDVTAREDK